MGDVVPDGQLDTTDMSWSFVAYTHYFEDLAGVIGGRFGTEYRSLAEGVHQSVLAHGSNAKARTRTLTDPEWERLAKSLRRSWGSLRRAHLEVADPDLFDAEANAWLPVMAYYGVYHGLVASSIARGQTLRDDHRAALNAASTLVTSGALPYPWSASCSGCPQDSTEQLHGCEFATPGHVRVHWDPDPDTSDDRLKMLLRTTRAKELERRFAEERRRGVLPGRSRRNLNRTNRDRIAGSLVPTTLFDALWRLRKRVNYDDADDLVFGATDKADAKRLADALVIVGDATVAALEGIVAAYVPQDRLADIAAEYGNLTGDDTASIFAAHMTSLRNIADEW
ncbi:MAG: hypothetical protein M3Q30_01680 [Actinomycetota bacterium]|nr:hypothetical protein [Actinomycetota bacterium]